MSESDTEHVGRKKERKSLVSVIFGSVVATLLSVFLVALGWTMARVSLHGERIAVTSSQVASLEKREDTMETRGSLALESYSKITDSRINKLEDMARQAAADNRAAMMMLERMNGTLEYLKITLDQHMGKNGTSLK